MYLWLKSRKIIYGIAAIALLIVGNFFLLYLNELTSVEPIPPLPFTVSIIAPTNGSIISGIVPIVAEATDNTQVVKVEFYIDGALRFTDTSLPYSYSWESTTFPNGPYTLFAKAYGEANNAAASSEISVIVSNILPPPAFKGHTPGIYALRYKSKRPVVDDAVKPYTAGFTVRIFWSDLEPEDGVYDFSFIDQELDRAKSLGKKVGLTVPVGVRSPSWLCASTGAQCFTFADNRTGETQKAPVPWDPVMLSYVGRMFQNLGTRYDSKPELERVTVVGPNVGTAEMVLQSKPEDIEQWQLLGYSDEKMSSAWKQAIDQAAAAFPTTGLVLKLNPLPDTINSGIKNDVPFAVADYGQGKYGERFYIEQDSLGNTEPKGCGKEWGGKSSYCKLYSYFVSNLAPKGIQPGERKICGPHGDSYEEDPANGCSPTDEYTAVLDRFFSLGASYIEVNQWRLQQADHQEILQDTADRLKQQ